MTLALASTAASAQPAPAPATPAATVPADLGTIQQDPSVRRGVLPNGLRYAVMRNASPKGGLSIRLGVDVGAYEEADAERGVAHFVEHMAFNGTRNFAEDKLVDAFATRGVAFGRDLNAATGLFTTTYKLDLPATSGDQVDTAFRWLRDVADGVLFSDEAVGRERGVILAEAETRATAQAAVQDAVAAFQGGGLRSVARDPIGTPEVIRAVDGARLRAFYDRWYRPENATVVVVGDLPVEAMEAQVKAAFSDWAARGPAPVRAPRNGPDLKRGLDVFARSEPKMPTVVSACRLRDADPMTPDDVARLRRQVTGQIWRTILTRRLDDLRERPEAGVVGGIAVGSDAGRDVMATCLSAMPTRDAWDAGLRAVQAELRRFAEHGPTELETEQAVEEIRARLRGSIDETSTRESDDVADRIVEADLERGVFPSPREALRVFNVAVEDLTPEAVRAAFLHDWSGAGPLLAVIAPEAPKPDALRAAWRAGESGTVEKYADRKAVSWAYTDFGPAGRVERRETVATPGFVRLRFQNGVVLNFKHTDFQKGVVEVRVRFGAGRREIDNKAFLVANMGAGLLLDGGLGKHSGDEVKRLFQNISWGAKLSINDESFSLSGTATAGSLESELQLLAALMTDPGFRPTIDATLPTMMDASYRSYRTSPEMVLSEALVRGVAPGSSYDLPPREVFTAVRSADFAKALRPALTEAPMEVTVVGDVDEKAATDLVARTLGALPARDPAPRTRADTWWLRLPETPPAPIRATHEGSSEQAMASLTWGLYVAEPSRRREEYALYLLSRVFTDELRRRVREQLGKTYAPDADTSMPDGADQGTLTATVETRPEDLDAVVAEVRAVAARLAAGEITPEALEAVRRPLLSRADARQSSNDWWASAMSGSARDPQILADAMEYRPILTSLTVDDLKKAAATWLSRPPVVVTAAPAPKGATK
jgi:zinc protease